MSTQLGQKTGFFSNYFLRREELYRGLLGRCILLAGVMMVASGLVGLLDPGGTGGGADGDNTDAQLALVIGGWMCLAGGIGTRLHSLPRSPRRRDVFAAAGLAWLAVIGFSVLFYMLTENFTKLDDALFESVAGFATTNFSTVSDPSQLSSAVLVWRAGTQWLGGAGALSVSLLLIPMFGSWSDGGPDAGALDKVKLAKFWARGSDFSKYFRIYILATAALAAGYWAFGMGGLDALSYAFSTISTGGFANHSRSLAHFGSVGIEWVAIAGMFVAGINGLLLFRSLGAVLRAPLRGSQRGLQSTLRGESNAPEVLWRSLEFKIYAAVVAAASVVCFIWVDTPDLGLRLREVLFAVTSAVSTTGFRVVDWGDWNAGLMLLLLLLIATGAMVGSTSGGFKIQRATEAAHYLWSEIFKYVGSVRATARHDLADEESLSRMQAFQMVYLSAVAAGAFGLAVFGNDLVTSLSGSVSALATMGPAMGELGPLTQADVLSRPERGLLAVLMLLGRLFIYPVLIIFGTLFTKALSLRRR